MRKNIPGIVTPLSRMKNNNPFFISSRGDNFLFKNIKFFKIRQKSKKLKKMKFQIFKILEISEICLISLYISFTNVKGNQTNLKSFQNQARILKTQISFFQNSEFLMDFLKKYIFVKEIIPSRA